MKQEDIDYVVKQTLIEASLHHEEERQKYYNDILSLVNHAKYLEYKLTELLTELNKDPI